MLERVILQRAGGWRVSSSYTFLVVFGSFLLVLVGLGGFLWRLVVVGWVWVVFGGFCLVFGSFLVYFDGF